MPYRLGAIVVTSSIRALWGRIKLINLTKTQHLSFSILDYIDLDESDVVQPDLVYLSSSHYWFSDDNTGTTIQHSGNRWCWERGPFTELKAAVREVWCDESSILRRLTLNFLGLISVPVPKSLQNPFSLTDTSRACLVMQTVRICAFLSFVSP